MIPRGERFFLFFDSILKFYILDILQFIAILEVKVLILVGINHQSPAIDRGEK